jgi:plastocyanin
VLPIQLKRIHNYASTLLLFLAGCNSTTHQMTEAHIDPATGATITGRVVFSGNPPKPVPIDMSANPTCERQHKSPVYTDQSGTFVWIKSGLPDAHWTPPAEPVKLNQEGCIYTPHILGIMTGQTLEIDNSDPLNHNVHAEAKTNASWNESQPPRAEKKFKTFEKQEVLFPVTCSVHPWMRAYLGVVAHPFFAVTAADGTFTIKGVPPGTYVLEAVNEINGRKETTVTLAQSAQKSVDFTYAPVPPAVLLPVHLLKW